MAPASVAIVLVLLGIFLLITVLVCMARVLAKGFAVRMFASRTSRDEQNQQPAEGSTV